MRFLTSLVIVAAISTTCLAEPIEPIIPHTSIVEHGDQEKLYVATFTATWCPTCKSMPDLVKQLRGRGVRTYVFDYDQHPGAVKALGITAVPAVVVMNRGKILTKVYDSPERLLDRILRFIEGIDQLDEPPNKTLDYILCLPSTTDTSPYLPFRVLLPYSWKVVNKRLCSLTLSVSE